MMVSKKKTLVFMIFIKIFSALRVKGLISIDCDDRRQSDSLDVAIVISDCVACSSLPVNNIIYIVLYPRSLCKHYIYMSTQLAS